MSDEKRKMAKPTKYNPDDRLDMIPGPERDHEWREIDKELWFQMSGINTTLKTMLDVLESMNSLMEKFEKQARKRL